MSTYDLFTLIYISNKEYGANFNVLDFLYLTQISSLFFYVQNYFGRNNLFNFALE